MPTPTSDAQRRIDQVSQVTPPTAPSAEPVNIYIPGITDIIRLPGILESHQQRYRRALEKTAPHPTPEALTSAVNWINYLDDIQDTLWTIAYPTGIALRYFAPRLVPYLGAAMLANDALNLATSILAIPLSGRLPKRGAIRAMAYNISREAAQTLASHFTPTWRGAAAWALQAAQASQAWTGYGLSLGAIMGLVSDVLWLPIRMAQTMTLPSIVLPHQTDPLTRAARAVVGFITNLPLWDWSTPEEKAAQIAATAWAIDTLRDNTDPLQAEARWATPTNPTELISPTRIWSPIHDQWATAATSYPTASPRQYIPPEALTHTNIPKTATKLTPRLLDDILAGNLPVTDKTEWLFMAHDYAWQAVEHLTGQMRRQSLTKFQRWLTRTIETGWYPPFFARPGYRLWYAPPWPTEARLPERRTWYGASLELYALPPSLDRGQTFSATPANIWLWYRRSAELYGRNGTTSYWFGNAPSPSRYPILVHTRRTAEPAVTQAGAYHTTEEAWLSWGPWAPLQAAIELWGQAVSPPREDERPLQPDDKELGTINPWLHWIQYPDENPPPPPPTPPTRRIVTWDWYQEHPHGPDHPPQPLRDHLPPQFDPNWQAYPR